MSLRHCCLVALFLLVLPALVQAQFTFTTNNGSITITGYTGAGGTVIIPDSTNGYPVTDIGQYAFYQSGLTDVSIPDSVTNIGYYAFSDCFSLTNVTMGNGVTCIGLEAFFQCVRLTDLTLPNSVVTIGYQAFTYCSGLTNLIIPDSVTNIGSFAFRSCSSLTNETIPDSVISIGSGPFADCTSLTNITVSSSNLFYSSTNGVLFDKTQANLIQYPDGLTNDCYTIPGGVTNIGDSAFYGSTLTSIVIPNSVTGIGGGTFDLCWNLASVTFPSSLKSIGVDAFHECIALTNVIIPASVTTIGDGAFAASSSLVTAYFEGNAPPDDGTVFLNDPAIVYYLPGTTGWSSTFGGVLAVAQTPPCQFTYITNSDGISITITGYTGSNSVVAIPNHISDYAVTSIGVGAFEGSKLGSITIPDSITSIGDNAFYYCSSLASVYFLGNAPNVGSSVFGWLYFFFPGPPQWVYPNCYYLPGTTGWDNNYGGCPAFMLVKPYICAVTNGAITISGYTGDGGNLVIPDSIAGLPVVGLGSASFFGSSLTNIVVPDSITNLGYWVFANCTSLESVYFLGNAPVTAEPPSYDETEFDYDNGVTVFYLPGTTGWGPVFGDGPTAYGGGSRGGAQTALWLPSIQTTGASFGASANQFGFNINWASGQTVVVEACTNLFNPVWTPISTNTLTCGTNYFNDAQWTNYPSRFYRISSP